MKQILTRVARRTYELAPGVQPSDFKGQRAIVARVLQCGAGTLENIVRKCTAAGIVPREDAKIDIAWCIKVHLREMVHDGHAKVVSWKREP